MMYVKFSTVFLFGFTAYLANVSISFARRFLLLTPIRAIVRAVTTFPIVIIFAGLVGRFPGCQTLLIAKLLLSAFDCINRTPKSSIAISTLYCNAAKIRFAFMATKVLLVFLDPVRLALKFGFTIGTAYRYFSALPVGSIFTNGVFFMPSGFASTVAENISGALACASPTFNLGVAVSTIENRTFVLRMPFTDKRSIIRISACLIAKIAFLDLIRIFVYSGRTISAFYGNTISVLWMLFTPIARKSAFLAAKIPCAQGMTVFDKLSIAIRAFDRDLRCRLERLSSLPLCIAILAAKIVFPDMGDVFKKIGIAICAFHDNLRALWHIMFPWKNFTLKNGLFQGDVNSVCYTLPRICQPMWKPSSIACPIVMLTMNSRSRNSSQPMIARTRSMISFSSSVLSGSDCSTASNTTSAMFTFAAHSVIIVLAISKLSLSWWYGPVMWSEHFIGFTYWAKEKSCTFLRTRYYADLSGNQPLGVRVLKRVQDYFLNIICAFVSHQRRWLIGTATLFSLILSLAHKHMLVNYVCVQYVDFLPCKVYLKVCSSLKDVLAREICHENSIQHFCIEAAVGVAYG